MLTPIGTFDLRVIADTAIFDWIPIAPHGQAHGFPWRRIKRHLIGVPVGDTRHEKEYQGKVIVQNMERFTLRSVLGQTDFLPFRAALKIMLELLNYVENKQNEGIVFPILRPEDITVNEWGGEPEISLPSDMQQHTAYLSPEVQNGHTPDERSTVWALGTLFFQLITGHRLEGFQNRVSTLPDILEIRPDLTEEMALILYHMVECDRDLRMENLTSFRSELQHLAALNTDTHPAGDDTTSIVDAAVSESTFRNRDEKLFSSSGFVGREHELAVLTELISEGNNRLITVIGPGGMGKSRLAFELLQRISGTFADGGYFVALNGIRSPAFIALAIANTLGFTFDGKRKPADQLRNYLSRREIILVLDDFDELIEGADVILNILDGSPGLHLIVTSRERLNVRSERVFELGGLPVPDTASAKPAMEKGSVQLFEQHAYRVHPSLSGDSERKGIIRICRLLEGIPLGIEMAAQWTRVLTCNEIADEIKNDIGFLETSERDVPMRHRGMKATFDRSWELLSDLEQNGLVKLSLFRGDFRRDAAESIAGIDLRLLAVLVNKSLIFRSAPGRYRFHELIRQYCARKLDTTPDLADNTATDFALFYGRLLNKELHRYREYEQQKYLEDMEDELSNIRVAWEIALRKRMDDVLLKMYRPLYVFFEAKGWIRESYHFWKDSVDRLNEDPAGDTHTRQRELYGCMLSRLAYTYMVRGQYETARTTFSRAYDILKSVQEQSETIMILAGLGEVASREGDYSGARTVLMEGLDRCKELNERTPQASLLDNMGTVSMYQGDYDNSRRYHEQSISIWKEIGHHRGIAKSLNNIGNVHYCQGAMDRALNAYEEAILFNKRAQSKRGLRTAMSNKGNVLTHKGKYEEARSLYRECLELAEELGDLHGIAHAKYQLSITAYSMGDITGSLRLGKESLAIHEETGERRGQGLVLESLGIASLRNDDLPAATTYLNCAVHTFRELHAQWGLASALSHLCEVNRAAGEWQKARESARESLEIASSIESENIISEALIHTARIMEHRGDLPSAYRMLTCVMRNQDHEIRTASKAEKARNGFSSLLDDATRDTLESSVKNLSLVECAKEAIDYLDDSKSA